MAYGLFSAPHAASLRASSERFRSLPDQTRAAGPTTPQGTQLDARGTGSEGSRRARLSESIGGREAEPVRPDAQGSRAGIQGSSCRCPSSRTVTPLGPEGALVQIQSPGHHWLGEGDRVFSLVNYQTGFEPATRVREGFGEGFRSFGSVRRLGFLRFSCACTLKHSFGTEGSLVQIQSPRPISKKFLRDSSRLASGYRCWQPPIDRFWTGKAGRNPGPRRSLDGRQSLHGDGGDAVCIVRAPGRIPAHGAVRDDDAYFGVRRCAADCCVRCRRTAAEAQGAVNLKIGDRAVGPHCRHEAE